MKKVTFSIFIIILVFSNYKLVFSQKNFSDGYIITVENDTVQGKVRDKFAFSSRKVDFIDNQGNKCTYHPKDINGYSKSGIIDYMSIQEDILREFARIVVDGEIRLLKVQKTGTTTTSNTTGGTNYNSYSQDLFYLYNTRTKLTTRVLKLDFKNFVSDYFSDNIKLKEMILNKELRFGDLEIIVETYNKWKRNQ